MEDHRLDDGHVAVCAHDGGLALVVTRDVGQEEAGLVRVRARVTVRVRVEMLARRRRACLATPASVMWFPSSVMARESASMLARLAQIWSVTCLGLG